MKKRQVVAYLVIMLLLLCTSVYATISGTLSLSSSATTTAVSQGEEFTVILSIAGVDSSSLITGIDGYFYIDPDVYETISISNVTSLISGLQVYDADDIEEEYVDDAIVINFDDSASGTYTIAINSASGIEDAEILEITLTVKSSVEDGTYYNTVKSTNVEIASGTSQTTSVTDQSLVVLIGNSASSGDTNNNNTSNNNIVNNTTNNNIIVQYNNVSNNNTANNTANKSTNNKTSNNSANNSSDSTTANNTIDNTTATGTLPNTGYKLIVIPVIVLAILGFVFYKKYNQYNI